VAVKAANERKSRTENKDLSLGQHDIDADKLGKAIDDLTVEFGCQYYHHVLQLEDAVFNKLSADQLLKDMRNRAPKIELGPFMETARFSGAFVTGWSLTTSTNTPLVSPTGSW